MRISLLNGLVTGAVQGKGRTLVLLHSLLSDAASFDLIVPDLAADYRVVVIDLPGFGASASVEGTLDDVAERVAKAIREVAAEEPVSLLGNGYGGFIALLIALRYPQLVERLVLADCGACFPEPGRAAFRDMAAKCRKDGLAALTDTAMLRLFPTSFQKSHPGLLADRRAAFERTPADVFIAACEGLATLDVRGRVADLSLRTLVIAGKDDQATPPAMAIELAAHLPDARIVLLDDCAHVPPLQAPAEFLSSIQPFLAEKR